MAAGLGFKDFVTGEVLTAADVDGYLMQGVWVFASAAARDAAVTSPQEGNFAYLKDTNVTTYYTGSAWANLDTTGMTNPMTTTGDTIYSSSGSTPARLGIGTTGQVLTVAGGVPSWATAAAGGGMTLLSTTTLSGSSVTISSINQTYKHLFMIGNLISSASGNENIGLRLNGDTGSNYQDSYFYFITTNHGAGSDNTSTPVLGPYNATAPAYNSNNNFNTWFYRYTETETKVIQGSGFGPGSAEKRYYQIGFNSTDAITSITIMANGGGSFDAGTVYLYGVN